MSKSRKTEGDTTAIAEPAEEDPEPAKSMEVSNEEVAAEDNANEEDIKETEIEEEDKKVEEGTATTAIAGK